MAGVKKTTGGRRAPHANPIKLSQPGDDDILCGKDRACALHKGSQRFRAVIDSYRATYQKASTKYDKMCITKEIYEVLSQKSRFLKYNDKEKLWEEITPLQGRDKIGHALRFANNHAASGKTKKPRKALRRQGSFGSASNASNASSYALPTKAELVKNLVEVAVEEPKVMGALVDHLTLQDALAASVPSDAAATPEAKEAAKARHERVASLVDPLALENIAYAVDCKTDDAALDELIDLLNHDDTIQEEDIQDILDMAADAEVPTTITLGDAVADAPVSASKEDMAMESSGYDQFDVNTEPEIPPRKDEYAAKHQNHNRQTSDGIWSVMNEPLMDGEW